MCVLAIAAAGLNSSSPAMLITRQGGRVGCALAVAYFEDGCIVKRSQNRHSDRALENLVAGQESPRKHAACRRALLRTRGFTRVMKLDDLIEHEPHRTNGAVFVGTSVPIKLLFEFLEDDQTMDTFLDQFPMVTRDQARAVLGASRDMLLSAAGSETEGRVSQSQ